MRTAQSRMKWLRGVGFLGRERGIPKEGGSGPLEGVNEQVVPRKRSGPDFRLYINTLRTIAKCLRNGMWLHFSLPLFHQ